MRRQNEWQENSQTEECSGSSIYFDLRFVPFTNLMFKVKHSSASDAWIRATADQVDLLTIDRLTCHISSYFIHFPVATHKLRAAVVYKMKSASNQPWHLLVNHPLSGVFGTSCGHSKYLALILLCLW